MNIWFSYLKKHQCHGVQVITYCLLGLFHYSDTYQYLIEIYEIMLYAAFSFS
jgi:hypothetical protein